MKISYTPVEQTPVIQLPGSKSIANRMLILQALYNPAIQFINLPESTDTVQLAKALEVLASTHKNDYVELMAGDGGTTFRFLTALLAITQRAGKVMGSKQLLSRPNAGIADALNQAGFDVHIDPSSGSVIEAVQPNDVADTWTVDTTISSQYASALALIAPRMDKPIQINLSHDSVSLGYLDMTIALMQDNGLDIRRKGHVVYALPFEPKVRTEKCIIEADWSGLSYFVSAAAITKSVVHIYNVSPNSHQPDQDILNFFEAIEGTYSFEANTLILDGRMVRPPERLERDYTTCPDLYPAEYVTCFALGIDLVATGTSHIVHKESNRIEALETELDKWDTDLPDFDTHGDHRIAMSLAVLGAIKPINLRSTHVVSKSFPDFWQQLSKLGYSYS